MFRRRIFYNAETGAVLRAYAAEGNLKQDYAAENEAAALGLADCACLEWSTPDADIEAAFEPVDAEGNPRIVNVAVDISGEAPLLVFSYGPVLEPQPSETEDMAAALSLLGVEPEKGA